MESHNGTPQPKETSHLQLQQEVRNMITTLTKHLADLNRLRNSHRQDPTGHEDDDEGFKVVTLSGTNKGSVVQSDMEELARDGNYGALYGGGGRERVFAFANSNYQAVNNSVMLGGSYTAEDPGVHLDMSAFVENVGGKEAEKTIDEDEEDEEERKVIEEVEKLEEDVDKVFNDKGNGEGGK